MSLLLLGCASTEDTPYRVNSFSPKKGPSCPGDLVAMCDMHMGKPILCECVAPSSVMGVEEYVDDE